MGNPVEDGAEARVLLVRHGQSTWNAEGRWQGRADPPLSEAGERQARAAAAALDAVVAVWSSDLARARRTAELLAPVGVAVHLDARLRERHVGSWTGLTRAEIEARQPGWLDDGRRPAGWEDDEAVRTRAWSALRSVVATVRPGDAAVVVSHGGLIRSVVAPLGVSAWPVPNLGGVWLRRVRDGFELGPGAALFSVESPTIGVPPVALPE